LGLRIKSSQWNEKLRASISLAVDDWLGASLEHLHKSWKSFMHKEPQQKIPGFQVDLWMERNVLFSTTKAKASTEMVKD